MPELPEVEIYARYFARHALGQPISGIDVRDERILGKVRKRKFVESLVGKTFNRVRRHGKNLYADEALYQTSIHPQRGVDRLSSAEVKALFTAVRRILRETILRAERGLDRPPRYLIHRREEGERCPLCGGKIHRTVVFGRTTYYCGKHQR